MKHFMTEPLRILTKQLRLWHQVMRDQNVLETAKNRSLVAGAAFCVAFFVIFGRLADVMVIRSFWGSSGDPVSPPHALASTVKGARADILDCNGEILATHLVTGSVYANPKVIINAEEAAAKLSGLIPGLEYKSVLKKLTSDKGFIWIVRHITPQQQQAVNRLGIPGVYLQRDERRVYPYGPLVSHVLGYCGIDNNGLSGIEQYFDERLCQNRDPLVLSIDVRVQHVVRDELLKAVAEFQAVGANCIVMKVDTGEIRAMVSLPDYDPNLPNQNLIETTFNRNTLGMYESGSTFKIFNTAIALQTGTASLSSRYDNSAPIRIGRYSIKDFRVPKVGLLDVQEVFIHSSNIGSAKMALQFGGATQQQFLEKFGMLKAPTLELPEIGAPLVPKTWREVTTMTVAYGYGVAVSPLMLINGIRRVITGYVRDATLLKRDPETLPEPVRVLSPKIADRIRTLMRLVVTQGTARRANVPGYDVIGKTGSAHKTQGRGYADKAKLTSFIGAFPKDNPQYIVLLFLDDPKPTKNTHGYSTGGWTAAPTAGRVIARLAPLLGVAPVSDEEQAESMVAATHLMPISHVDDAQDDQDDNDSD